MSNTFVSLTCLSSMTILLNFSKTGRHKHALLGKIRAILSKPGHRLCYNNVDSKQKNGMMVIVCL